MSDDQEGKVESCLIPAYQVPLHWLLAPALCQLQSPAIFVPLTQNAEFASKA